MSAPVRARSSSGVGAGPHHTSMSVGWRGATRTNGAPRPVPNNAWYPGSAIPVRYKKSGSCRNRALPSTPLRVCAVPAGTYTSLPSGSCESTLSLCVAWSGDGSRRLASKDPEVDAARSGGAVAVARAGIEATRERDDPGVLDGRGGEKRPRAPARAPASESIVARPKHAEKGAGTRGAGTCEDERRRVDVCGCPRRADRGRAARRVARISKKDESGLVTSSSPDLCSSSSCPARNSRDRSNVSEKHVCAPLL